ncbi:Phospholipase/carboxylesterase/thioesterase [Kalmanozyma brasiliensis GHG001]|uniref:Phospholipase/carboxylesterase/thioesterase n=1 Tax=Kalmanozyma brasiliensis (strain GHG001) TaxID=1365824 RepID=UPI002867F687|nr:Phospholipase/carboxylesterase/thioesterase [Kalmanozyma brasiliensis GHG001]KAF6767224.1 Phospholipase/carboxylesterase/thioesterase [Kalmanozyma brasiliensis GHG001]
MSTSTPEISVDASSIEPDRKPLLPSPTLTFFSAHHFSPSPSGIDSNLLLLLHGLGDSDSSFFTLGQTLQRTLPQTAILTLQAPHLVPFLHGPHWMWYPSFDGLGELLTKPNPSQTVDGMVKVLEHLVRCGWAARQIHLFGFGQGATVALETLVSWSRTHNEALGSVVSVSGEMLSHPTSVASPTPVLHVYRSASPIPDNSTRWASHRKASSAFQLHRLPPHPQQGEEAMLRNNEWDPVMRFWSRFLRNRTTWEREGKVVQVG